MYVRKRLKVRQQGERRQIFLRYLGEVATAVSEINAVDRAALYEQLLSVAKKRTADADMKLDDRGRPIEDPDELELGENVLIVDPTEAPAAINRAPAATTEESDEASSATQATTAEATDRSCKGAKSQEEVKSPWRLRALRGIAIRKGLAGRTSNVAGKCHRDADQAQGCRLGHSDQLIEGEVIEPAERYRTRGGVGPGELDVGRHAGERHGFDLVGDHSCGGVRAKQRPDGVENVELANLSNRTGTDEIEAQEIRRHAERHVELPSVGPIGEAVEAEYPIPGRRIGIDDGLDRGEAVGSKPLRMVLNTPSVRPG